MATAPFPIAGSEQKQTAPCSRSSIHHGGGGGSPCVTTTASAERGCSRGRGVEGHGAAHNGAVGARTERLASPGRSWLLLFGSLRCSPPGRFPELAQQPGRAGLHSTYLEDCKFDRERIEQFCTEYQKNKDNLEILLGSTGRCPPHITDVCWRLEYQIKTNQLHKNYHPIYLMTLNVENNDSRSRQDVNFSCSMEQLQDLVGKLKDAAKSLERTTQQ
nr:PREDICTED: COMM domain-containing protein 3 isoform X2 [Anolis carolinensis]|eukprot:XP_016849788.1 PREDICTED: COMM domain-containing protein 3 isoform X2 [Anolis carolinensis]